MRYTGAMRRFATVDVFASGPLTGNPLAVVVDAEGLTDAQMAALANWLNLSETTFLLPPTDPAADYRVRIFTPSTELPFAGHPTLGSAATWLAHGGEPAEPGVIVQECGVGLVRLRRTGDDLAFLAPPLVRSGPVETDHLTRLTAVLGLTADEVVASGWVDNGPGWVGVEVADPARLAAIEPDGSAWSADDYVGVVARGDDSVEADIVLRAFFPGAGGQCLEDPVTGSLNASVAQWLVERGEITDSYLASQGEALGRAGRVRITLDGADIWVGGAVVPVTSGSVEL